MRRTLLACALTIAVLGACSAGAETATQAPTSADPGTCNIEWGDDGKLKPLADGFPAEAMTILVVDEAGSDDGIYARQMQKAATPLSPVRINVLDRPDFGNWGNWEAYKWVEKEPGGDEGYITTVTTVPGSTIDLINTPVMKAIDVTQATQNWAIGTEQAPFALVSRKGAPWGSSWEELVTYVQEHPKEVKYVSIGAGSGMDVAFLTYSSFVGGLEVNTVVGGSHAEIVATVASGAADIAMTVAGTARQFYDDGKIDILFVTNTNEPPAEWKGVRNMQTILGKDKLPVDPFGSMRGLVASEQTPDCHREWVYTLYAKAAENDEFIAARSQIPGMVQVTRDREGVLELVSVAYKLAWDVLEPLGMIDPWVLETQPRP